MIARRIARWRVPLGFAFAIVVLWFARPTWPSLAGGAAIAAAGEALRIWAAGHIDKSREVTSSGPYRYLRHPLYAGSSIMAVGLAVATSSLLVVAIVVVYLATTYVAAIRAEEAHLREKFGAAYDDYAHGTAAPLSRPFSLTRALHNREHHTIGGLLLALGLLALKVWLTL